MDNKTYMVLRRDTHELAFVVAISAQAALLDRSWLIGDCFVREVTPSQEEELRQAALRITGYTLLKEGKENGKV